MRVWSYLLPFILWGLLTEVETTSILFPSDLLKSHNLISSDAEQIYAIKKEPICVSKSAYGNVLCEDDEDYNEDVRQKFKEAFEKIHMTDKVFSSIVSKLMREVKLKPRIGDRIRDEPVCPSTERMIFPKRGKTDTDEWVFILNQDDLVQSVIVEECLNKSRLARFRTKSDWSCVSSGDSESTSTCQQKFIYRSMVTMKEKSSKVAVRSILLPSCCVCTRKNSLFKFDDARHFGLN